MQRYSDIVLDGYGNKLPGASVEVVTYPALAAATIYQADGSLPYSSNTLTTDSNGRYYFYADDGRYSLNISKTGYTSQTITDVLLEDPATGNPATVTTLTASGQITSTVATGTAPLVVASTTEVANLRAAKATALATARTIGGVSFDGSANITVSTATGGFTVSGGNFVSRGISDTATATALGLSGSGANSITIANSATNPSIAASGGNLVIGSGAALSTSATDGHMMIPTCAGAPTGVPTGNGAGKLALIYDSTNNKIYAYNGAWKSTAALV